MRIWNMAACHHTAIRPVVSYFCQRKAAICRWGGATQPWLASAGTQCTQSWSWAQTNAASSVKLALPCLGIIRIRLFGRHNLEQILVQDRRLANIRASSWVFLGELQSRQRIAAEGNAISRRLYHQQRERANRCNSGAIRRLPACFIYRH